MARYRVYGIVTGTKSLGEFDADSPEEAVKMGLDSDENDLIICHQCSRQVELDYSCASGIAELVD